MSFPWLAKMASFTAGLAIVASAVVAGVPDVTTRPTIVEHTTDASADGEVVVAIGDSIMEGHGLDASQAWPALLAEAYGWRLTSLASDGSGFVTVGNDGDTFADQAEVAIRLHPSIVIISGSSNDLGDSDAAIALETDSTMMTLRAALPTAEILAVSPVWNDTAEPAQLKLIGRDVVQAAELVGARDLEIGQPLYGASGLMQFDDVHPTAAGQRVIAAAVEKSLAG